MNVGLFIKDFEFGTKISEKLSELDLSIEFCETSSELKDNVQLLIVDLDEKDFGDEHFVRQLAGENKITQIIGFMEQVQKDKHSVFKKAGCSMILPKSSFIKNIETFINH